jgi:hypothetical protein
VEANSTGGQGSHMAVVPSDDDLITCKCHLIGKSNVRNELID